MSVTAILRRAPLLGPLLHRLRYGKFRGSARYWEQRYRWGSNSGTGSYGRLARFKADFLNRFVLEHDVHSVIELGCGDGAQLSLAHYPAYVGIDVSSRAIETCNRQFQGDPSKRFLTLAAFHGETTADLSLSLDVIYHVVEDPVYQQYMRLLFDCARRYVIIYSSNADSPAPVEHVRHRRFTTWIEEHRPDWVLTAMQRNAYPLDRRDGGETSFSDFYVFARPPMAEGPMPISSTTFAAI